MGKLFRRLLQFFTGRRVCALTALLLIFASACSGPRNAAGKDAAAALRVVVTFDALYEIASEIGGDRVSVTNIMPAGAEPHHFEPRARDLEALGTADVFVVCGLGFDAWARGAASAAGNSGMLLCDASRGVEPIAASGAAAESSGQRQDSEGYDPHIWLSLSCAAVMAENIADAFAEADPGGADLYRGNSDEFSRRAGELFEEYARKLDASGSRTIVTGHAVFAYLCRDFSLAQLSVEGAFAEGEPSARALAELVDLCRERGVRVILTEDASSPLVAETLAAEAGAVVAEIYTMELAEDGLSYFERMERNLAVILEALA